MSRIGKRPVVLPDGVEATVEGNVVSVKGPKGSLTQEFHPDMQIVKEDSTLIVRRPSDQKRHRALHGLTRSLLQNMVDGVTKGFQRNLEIQGVGYRAAKQGNRLVLTVGFTLPVQIEPPEGCEIEVPQPTKITVRGIDKQKVGELAARIRRVRPPEPYLGKGIRYEGERIRRKAGKAGKVGKK